MIFFVTCLPASGETPDYLNSLEGTWQGSGIVKVKTHIPEVPVDCKFVSTATDTSIKLDGLCTALLVIRKAVTAELLVSNDQYSGIYLGARTGPAGLNGSRDGNTIQLKITWADEVNGDRMARMDIAKVDEDIMVLQITDIDPSSGKPVTTSRFNLKRQ